MATVLETGQSSTTVAIFRNIVSVLINLCSFTPYLLQNTQTNVIWPEGFTELCFLRLRHLVFIGNSNLCLSCEKCSQKLEFPHHFLESSVAKERNKTPLWACVPLIYYSLLTTYNIIQWFIR